MDVGVVDGEVAVQPIEFGSIIANRYTILRPDKVGTPGAFIGREQDIEPLRSVWALRSRYDGDPTGQAFLSEMGQVQKLEHPQLRKVLDFGRDADGIVYAVFEPLEIRSLNDLLEKEWPLGEERVVWLMCQLLATLEVAHAANLTHGDLRPENVLVRAAGSTSQNEELLLCGLGLANSARYNFPNGKQHKLPSWVVGTPSYAAPEQLRGELHDARSDVYGAGLLMFQLLTRTLPFVAANDYDTAFMQCFTPPPPPSGYARVTPALEAICLKALTKTPDMRYQSANEMRAALLASQAARTSRAPSRISVVRSSRAPLARVSTPPEEVVATRISESEPYHLRVDAITAAPIETPLPAAAAQPRQRSATLLLVLCGLAVIAAVVLPDLRYRDADLELAQREEQAAAEPAEEPVAAPVAPVPAPAAQPATKPRAPVAPSAAPVVLAPVAIEPAKQPEAPAAAPAVKTAARPARVRIRNVEKRVIAAEATRTAEPFVATLEPVAPAAELPSVAADPQPSAAATVAAQIELPKLEAAQPAAPAPQAELPAPKPIILSTISPPAPATELAPTGAPASARDISVSISEASVERGAVSRASLRSTLNQAAITRCYRDAVRTGTAPAQPIHAQLDIATNTSGRITSAHLSGSGVPASLSQCVEEAARLGRVREADTGEVNASFGLIFRAR